MFLPQKPRNDTEIKRHFSVFSVGSVAIFLTITSGSAGLGRSYGIHGDT